MEIKINADKRWVQAEFSGAWDGAEAAKFFYSSSVHGSFRPRPLLLDLDALTEFPLVEDLLALFEAIPVCAFLAQKPVTYGLGRMVAALAYSRGVELALFRSPKAAEAHLLALLHEDFVPVLQKARA